MSGRHRGKNVYFHQKHRGNTAVARTFVTTANCSDVLGREVKTEGEKESQVRKAGSLVQDG